MSKPTRAYYIRENDFEGAKERFDSANNRWKQHWFDVCMEIAEKAKDWLKKYILDPITLTIEKVKKVANKSEGSNVYLIKMFDINNVYTYLKAGKADILERRLKQLIKLYKKENVFVSNIEVIKTWHLPNSHLAECFEQSVHAYLAKLFYHIPNDRYAPVELNEEHFAEIERRYEIISALA